MAKRLYDYWFVQYDFPNAEGKPYKASGGAMVYNSVLKRDIPEGWKVGNICAVADILSGGTPNKSNGNYWGGNIPFFCPTDFAGALFQLSTEEKITEDGLNHCASSLFEENTLIITARGSVGKIVIVGTPMAMNQSCYALKPKKLNLYEYSFFLAKQLIECLKVKSSGSVFKSIITPDIETSLLSLGSSVIVELFCERVRPMFQQIKTNTKENQQLIALRDKLLPLLMNGQVVVKPQEVNSDLSATFYISFRCSLFVFCRICSYICPYEKAIAFRVLPSRHRHQAVNWFGRSACTRRFSDSCR